MDTGHNVRLGALFMIGTCLLWMLQSALAKGLSDTYSILQLVFFRSLFGLGPSILFVWRQGGVSTLRTTQPLQHLLRATFWLGAFGFSFCSLRYLSVADTTAISFTGPLFIVALSWPILRQRVGWQSWLAVIIGFAGTIVMIPPSSAVFQFGALLSLLGALSFAAGSISVWHMVKTESSSTIAFYVQFFGTVMMGLTMPFVWMTPNWPDLVAFAGVGMIGGVAQIWGNQAMRYAPTSVAAPLQYTQMIWAVMLDFIFWHVLPSYRLVIGVAIIIASCLFIAYQQAQKPAAVSSKGSS